MLGHKFFMFSSSSDLVRSLSGGSEERGNVKKGEEIGVFYEVSKKAEECLRTWRKLPNGMLNAWRQFVDNVIGLNELWSHVLP